jgi:excisionase family DNA binding protein
MPEDYLLDNQAVDDVLIKQELLSSNYSCFVCFSYCVCCVCDKMILIIQIGSGKIMQLTKKDVSLAQQAVLALDARFLKSLTRNQARLVLDAEAKSEIALPPQAIKVLAEVLGHLAAGRDVTVEAYPVEMTTQQVADYLRVSRPFLIDLLDKGKIPHRKVGSHRRILFEDVAEYKRGIDEKRLETLEQLAAQAQDLKMGYDR